MSHATSASTATNVFLKRKPRNSEATLTKLQRQITRLESLVDQAISEPTVCCDVPPAKPEAVTVWGVPFSRLTLGQTLQHVERLIQHGEPGYFITANLNYNMLTSQHSQLRRVNDEASFIVCDGMPMVWRSRWTGRPLPERVAGSELIYALSKWAAHKGHRIYFLGGAPGVAQAAADKLKSRYPGLQVAGVYSPPFRELTEGEQSAMLDQIRNSRPDIVYIAFGQPKGELWMSEHFREINAPVCVQIGASFDFVAGGVARAPVWIQKIGLEWFYRLCQEPRRLTGRYLRNLKFLARVTAQEAFKR
ncbi:MAG: WecB/TagA/CpsF family glycosyltransferase [Pirellulaceae bacterium]